MKWFSALMRWLGAKDYQAAGGIQNATNKLYTDPNVVRAGMDEVIKVKQEGVNEMINAISVVTANLATSQTAKAEVDSKLERSKKLRDGAKIEFMNYGKAQLAAGKTEAEIKADPEYVRLQKQYNDTVSTLATRQKRSDELQAEIHRGEAEKKKLMFSLEGMQRDLKDTVEKKGTLAAKAAAAQSALRAQSIIAGLQTDKTGELQANIEGAVNQLVAKSEVVAEIAGTNADMREAELLALAESHESDSELDGMLFGAKRAEDAAKAKAEKPVASTESGVLN